MKWSEINYSDYYVPFDENQRAIRGFWLTTLGIDLENMSDIFMQTFKLFETKKSCSCFDEKVHLTSIVGTSHQDYGNMPIVLSFAKIKRAHRYITDGYVTRGKYFYNLKRPINEQEPPILFPRAYIYEPNFINRITFGDITNKYWLNAKINDIDEVNQ